MTPAHPTLAMVIPSFNHMAYLNRTIRSFYKYSPWLQFIVVDDASTEWDMRWRQDNPDANLTLFRFPENGGLTRSWNKGFQMIQELPVKPEYTIFGNADILANKGWWRAMVDVLNRGFHLTGPVSNAPGITAQGKQEVSLYFPKYHVTDNADYNNQVASYLWDKFGQSGQSVTQQVNGFFMMGKTATFEQHSHNSGNVFQPVITRMPSGRLNPTPLMTGNEDELQHRWGKKGLRSVIAVGSYIFHYRSVARGVKYAKKGWYRCVDFDHPV